MLECKYTDYRQIERLHDRMSELKIDIQIYRKADNQIILKD